MKLDANDLARWTRFAAKGGIGKCSAVQDCIAESPEDLMFLQNDEIVVLMQLQGQPGCYLGYCEGVVGRFRGSDVRFHTKLKRPVLTKRSSVAASPSISTQGSVAGSPLSPSPLSAMSPISGGLGDRWERSMSRERSVSVSAVTSPTTSATSSPQIGVLKGLPTSPLPSHPGHPPSKATNENGRTSLAEPKEAVNRNLDEEVDADLRTPMPGVAFNVGNAEAANLPDSEGSSNLTSKSNRRRTQIVGDMADWASAVPNSNGEPNSTQSRPGSAPPSDGESSSLGTKSGRRRTGLTDLFPAPPVPSTLVDRQHSPSPSLGSGAEDAVATSKSSRRRTRILGDPSILSPPSSPLPGGNFTPSSTSPIPPSPGLPSKAYEQSNSRSETPQSPTSRRKSVADVDKSARRRTGLIGDWTLAVQSDGEVLASPSPMRAEFSPSEVPKEEDERKGDVEDETDDKQAREPSIEKEDQTASPPAAPAEALIIENTIAPASDVSLDMSLYDKASLHSAPSVSSTSSHSLLYASRRFDDDNDNTFMSTDSAGGLLNSLQRRLDDEDGDRSRDTNRGSIGLGIGLTMLQDMVDATSSEGSDFDEDDDASRDVEDEEWMPQRENNTQTPEPKRGPSLSSEVVTDGPEGVDGGLLASPESLQSTRTSSTTLNTSNDNSGMTSPSFPITPRPSGSFRIPVSVSDLENSIPARDAINGDESAMDPVDNHHDHEHENEHDADEEDEDGEWDGYGDIYDNYRYSRYSLTSRKSRFSTISTNKSALSASIDDSQDPVEAMPPMPSEAQLTSRRPSDAQMSTGSGDERTSGNEQSQHRANPEKPSAKHVPPPLNLTAPLKIHPKPLLSPPSSSGPTSPLSFRLKGDAASSSSPIPPGTPLLAPSPFGGAASALRQRLESERVEDAGAPTARPISSVSSSEGDGLGGGIVIADEGSDIHGDIDTSKDESSRVDTSVDVSQQVEKREDDTEVKIDLSMASMSMSTSMTSERSESSSMMSGLTAEMRRMEDELHREVGNASVLSNLSNTVVQSTPPLRLQDRASPRTAQFPQNTGPDADKQTLGAQQQEWPEPQARPRPRPGNQGSSPFLPHPGAPKPHPDIASGNRISTFGMPPVHPVHQSSPQQPQLQQTTPESPSLHVAMRQASMARIGPNGVPRVSTIYGRTVVDLSMAVEPVPMVWSLEPFPPATTGAGPSAASRVPRRAATAAASPLSSSVVLQANGDGEIASVSMTPPSREGSPASHSSRVIPRANFFPKAAGPRPRSRSFSGFEAPPANALSSGRSKEDAGLPTRVGSMQSLRSGFLGELPPSRLSSSSIGSSNSGRAGHTPSPLSLRGNTTVVSPAPKSPLAPKTSPSPLAMSFSREERQSEDNVLQPPPPQLKGLGIRQVASTSALRPERPASPPSEPPVQASATNEHSPESPAVPASHSIASTAFQKLRRLSSTSRKHQRTVSQQSRSSTHSDTRSDAMSPPPIQRSSSSASPMHRSNSLKSKLSLSALRIRNTSAKEEQSSPSTAPPTPLFEFDDHPETVQVKDVGFEIIRPPMRQMSTDPGSDDSFSRDERPSIQINARTESPFSSVSGGARSPIPPRFIDSPEPMPRLAQSGDASESNTANAEAHRSREQRWITTMAAVPASQSRKSKKIRRLVLEGVPSSVRYLVWSHLVDSKAKTIPGVYDKFGKREKVAIISQIEEDARRCFPGQQHLQDAKGPLVTLLTTYLTMFPDIEYQRSLVAIAGHLLLQAPEEDAFWMFVSIMDAHIRTYFSSKAVQMDVDANIFGKVVEATQPQLAKRLFVELGITPVEICRPWFSSVFATSLPPECVNRVWDVFLCEGPPFLFRIALALLSLCRTHIESGKDKTSVLVVLACPEALSLVPSDPDDLITSALSVKLKDDDIKKQRIKLEAQMKRQTQSLAALASRSTPSLVSKISLPR